MGLGYWPKDVSCVCLVSFAWRTKNVLWFFQSKFEIQHKLHRICRMCPPPMILGDPRAQYLRPLLFGHVREFALSYFHFGLLWLLFVVCYLFVFAMLSFWPSQRHKATIVVIIIIIRQLGTSRVAEGSGWGLWRAQCLVIQGWWYSPKTKSKRNRIEFIVIFILRLRLCYTDFLSFSCYSFFIFGCHAAFHFVVGFQFRCELSLLGAFRAERQHTFICAWQLREGHVRVAFGFGYNTLRCVLPLKLQVMMLASASATAAVCCLLSDVIGLVYVCFGISSAFCFCVALSIFLIVIVAVFFAALLFILFFFCSK